MIALSAPVAVDLGCWCCRVLADAVRARALDLAMYEGMVLGVRLALGAAPPLCADHLERWELVRPSLELTLASTPPIGTDSEGPR